MPADGIKLAYRVLGKDEGIPLVMLSSLGNSYERIHKRTEGRGPDISQESSFAGLQAVLSWAEPYPDALEELKAVSLPVLIFQGKEDLPVPVVNAERMAASFSMARLMVYADAGHAAIFKNAADFTKTVSAFLNQ